MPMRSMTKRMLTMVAVTLSAAMKPTMAVAGQDAAQVKRGQDVYTAQKCQGCHAIGGKGMKANPLDGVGSKLSAADIRAWIVTPTSARARSAHGGSGTSSPTSDSSACP